MTRGWWVSICWDVWLTANIVNYRQNLTLIYKLEDQNFTPENLTKHQLRLQLSSLLVLNMSGVRCGGLAIFVKAPISISTIYTCTHLLQNVFRYQVYHIVSSSAILCNLSNYFCTILSPNYSCQILFPSHKMTPVLAAECWLLAGEAMQLYSFAKLVNKISFWWFDKTSFIFQLLVWIEYEVIYIE